jgi:hypothetical protein
MTGVPVLFTFWVTPYFYPILSAPPSNQHYHLLALVAWMLTIGPKENWYKSLFGKKSDVKQNKKKKLQ